MILMQRAGSRLEEVRAMRKRVLCATDLSPRSDQAMLRAALLAKQMNAQALFVHAVDDSQPGRTIRMKVNRAQARLLSQSERAMKHAPKDAEIAVRLGTPVQAIAAASAEWNPDLVIMAAPRKRRLDFVVGTTAERVIRATHRPVLIVSGAATGAYEKVVLATDLSPTSAHVARTVVDMGLLANAYAWLVHAFAPPHQGMITTEVVLEEQLTERWRDAISRELVRELEEAGVDRTRVHIAAEPARPLDAIERALERARPELLVIGVSRWFMLKRLLVGSVADQVLRKINCDVLAISPSAARKNWLRAA
jgi:nucleotide-binding universal stress UspA family protein